MAEPAARLYLITPLLEDASFTQSLSEACGAGDVAAVLLRLASGDERGLINTLKVLTPVVQDHGAAAIVMIEGEADLATLAARSGADGIHIAGRIDDLRALRERLKERAIGAGGIRTRDEAMILGEAGADYLLFGEPRLDGSVPALETILDRVAWWAEIFETPCIAYAPSLDDVKALAATGAEFVALGDAVWSHAEGPAAAVRAALSSLKELEIAP